MKIRLIGKKHFIKTKRRKEKDLLNYTIYIPVEYGIKKNDNVLMQKVELKYAEDGNVKEFKRIGEYFIKQVVDGPKIYFTKPHISEGDTMMIQKIEIVEDRIEIVE
jgi:hypothetical protein